MSQQMKNHHLLQEKKPYQALDKAMIRPCLIILSVTYRKNPFLSWHTLLFNNTCHAFLQTIRQESIYN